MPAFAAMVSHTKLTFDHLTSMSDLCRTIKDQFPDLTENLIRHNSLIASRFSLPHSAVKQFVLDPQTQSWICCIGNPRSASLPGQGQTLAANILRQYLDHGPSCITSLDAPFVVAIYDSVQHSFHLATDRVGLQHIYMATIDGATIFATSALAIAAITNPSFDKASLAHYFSIGHLLEDRTLFEGIKKIPDATWLTIDRTGLKTAKYWTPPHESRLMPPKLLASELSHTFTSLLDQRLDNAPVSIELTGGHDSRLNLVAALRCAKPFQGWTIAENNSAELAVINKLRQVVDFPHQVISPVKGLEDSFLSDLDQINTLTDGETNALNLIASLACNRQTNPQRLASISGMGGEILRGFYYITHMGIPNSSSSIYFDRIISLKMLPHIGFTPAIFSDFFPPDHHQLLRDSVRTYFDRTAGQNLFWRLDDFYFRARQQRFAGRSCSFNSYFYRTEIPFFANDIIDISYRAPWKLKKNSRLVRQAIELCNPALAAVDMLNGRPARPFHLTDTHKMIAYYARLTQKAFTRMRSHLLKTTSPAHDPVGIQALIRKKLCSPQLISDVLNYNTMSSAFLYDSKQFHQFLTQNAKADFPNLYQLGLILSFELTCRQLRRSSSRLNIAKFEPTAPVFSEQTVAANFK
ncbi:MAG: hypothetical protein A2Y07_04055 [Planctomycetes bacterium GWF2_50_10]|nr:MAG: hypothetical protein A2Y07_04055 [Planctomycetes bacterium GWF2_50_10]